MNIYDYVFGVSCGQVQVQCCFHDDTKASAGIGPDLQYNCFACGAKGDGINYVSEMYELSQYEAAKKIIVIPTKIKIAIKSASTGSSGLPATATLPS